MGNACCGYHNPYRKEISEKMAYNIYIALEEMREIHHEKLPPPVRIPLNNRVHPCHCNRRYEIDCICPINFEELGYSIINTIQTRMYSIKGSDGFYSSSKRLAYLLYIAENKKIETDPFLY
jgi:hypothetical protein